MLLLFIAYLAIKSCPLQQFPCSVVFFVPSAIVNIYLIKFIFLHFIHNIHFCLFKIPSLSSDAFSSLSSIGA